MPATSPVFVDTTDILLERVRMRRESAPDGLVEQAMEEVRLELFSETRGLGAVRVAEVQAIPYVQDSNDPTSLQRTCANVLEVLMFRRQLLYTMPSLFMDEGVEEEAWNEDGFVRAGSDRIQDMIQELNLQIHDKLAELRQVPEQGGRISAFVIEPDNPCRPFDSIRPLHYGRGSYGA